MSSAEPGSPPVTRGGSRFAPLGPSCSAIASASFLLRARGGAPSAPANERARRRSSPARGAPGSSDRGVEPSRAWQVEARHRMAVAVAPSPASGSKAPSALTRRSHAGSVRTRARRTRALASNVIQPTSTTTAAPTTMTPIAAPHVARSCELTNVGLTRRSGRAGGRCSGACRSSSSIERRRRRTPFLERPHRRRRRIAVQLELRGEPVLLLDERLLLALELGRHLDRREHLLELGLDLGELLPDDDGIDVLRARRTPRRG